MERTRRHGIYYITSLLAILGLYTVLYKTGMAVLEGRERTVIQSLSIVVETMTTTGYGEDAPWTTDPMLGLMMLMQATGVFYIFLTLPLFLVPWIETRLQARVPKTFDATDHVVVCGYSSIGDELVDELESHGVEYVVLIDDREKVKEIRDNGYSAVFGDPESVDALSKVSVESARTVVLDETDEQNATIALAIRELTEVVSVAAFVEEQALSTYIRLAGVDTPLNPRELVGQGLAEEVSRISKTELGSTVDIAADFQVIELPLTVHSRLVGRRIETAGIREETGANVIGAWIDGDFRPNPSPSTELDRGTVLLVSGTKFQLQSLIEWAGPNESPGRRNTILAGYGDTGRAVSTGLNSAHVACTIIDKEDKDNVDVVGDATERAVLEEAGIDSANALIVTVGDDTQAIFMTLLARDLNPDAEIVVRANEVENRAKLVAAGADYVLPLAAVSARMLASTISEEDVISYETQIDIVRVKAPALEGQTLEETNIRARTGCIVLAIEREGETHTELGPTFELAPEDELVVAGTDENIEQFQTIAGSATA